MTPRTIESEFTDSLLKQLQPSGPWDLTPGAPIMVPRHPKLIWAKLQFEHDPHLPLPEITIPGQYYDCFASVQEAQAKYPQVPKSLRGLPYVIGQVLQNPGEPIILDFEIGAVLLSMSPLNPQRENKLYWHELPIWLSYALSPELWGPNGKWTRFHEKLEAALTERKLLASQCQVGYYPLKPEAKRLEEFGFTGKVLPASYDLSLPWTFPLSALEKLEKAILQEF